MKRSLWIIGIFTAGLMLAACSFQLNVNPQSSRPVEAKVDLLPLQSGSSGTTPKDMEPAHLLDLFPFRQLTSTVTATTWLSDVYPLHIDEQRFVIATLDDIDLADANVNSLEPVLFLTRRFTQSAELFDDEMQQGWTLFAFAPVDFPGIECSSQTLWAWQETLLSFPSVSEIDASAPYTLSTASLPIDEVCVAPKIMDLTMFRTMPEVQGITTDFALFRDADGKYILYRLTTRDSSSPGGNDARRILCSRIRSDGRIGRFVRYVFRCR